MVNLASLRYMAASLCREVLALRLDCKLSIPRPRLAAVHRRLRAPLGGEAADCYVYVLVETQEIADHLAVQERAVGVRVR